ncbi:MAG: hypothetical protein U9Q68_07640 [Euryarchaeota archaeon]|nr:hypothetical protein [Euryarchaeota archaeon]
MNTTELLLRFLAGGSLVNELNTQRIDSINRGLVRVSRWTRGDNTYIKEYIMAKNLTNSNKISKTYEEVM